MQHYFLLMPIDCNKNAQKSKFVVIENLKMRQRLIEKKFELKIILNDILKR